MIYLVLLVQVKILQYWQNEGILFNMAITVTGISISGGVFVLSETMVPNQTVYSTPGRFYWTCPAGVTLVSVVCVGGGGGGGDGRGGGGGGLGYKNNISVVPGLAYIVVVGAGGTNTSTDGTAGGDSYFIDPYIVKGGGGSPGTGGNGSITNASNGIGGTGGNYIGDGGGNGGRGGGWVNQASQNRHYGGGGGAGGYSGNGGNGGSGTSTGTAISATAGTGGGGGGGNHVTGSNLNSVGGGGGGVSLLGQTTNGSAGTAGTGLASGGGAGSGGVAGTDGSSASPSLSLNSVSGGNYGGGGGATYYNTGVGYSGDTVTAGGAVRIIWGTTGGVRKFPGPTYGTVDQSISTPVPSSDATLSNLVLSLGAMTPTFSPSYFDPLPYQYICTALTSSYTLTPTASNQYATLQLTDYNPYNTPVSITSGVAISPVGLGGLGSNSARGIIVTAQDGTTRTYYVIVNQYAGSPVNTLSGLTLSSGTLSPAFSSGTTTYTASVTNATASINVTPTVTDSNSTITVNGNSATSGSPVAVNMSYGSNTLTIVVTSQSGITKTYTTTVTRALSSVATLATLVITGGNNGVTQPLSPAFVAGTVGPVTYTGTGQSWDNGTGNYNQRSFTYSLTTTHPLATVQFYDGVYYPTLSTVPNDGTIFGGYLQDGNNAHQIRVTAQDGSTNIFVINTFKQAQGQVSVGYGTSYSTPGLYTWTCPPGVTSVSVICVGAGGGGGNRNSITGTNYGGGGGGGGLRYINNYSVTAGQVYTVYAGAGGAPGVAGTASYFNTTSVVSGNGGGNGTYATSGTATGGAGGTGTGTGFNGGVGGASTSSSFNGGGGGAGGYSANGGAGGTGGGNGGTGVTGGGGAGGGSSYGTNSGNYTIGGSGGGVGLYGKTTGGSPGIGGNTSGYAYRATGGGGGSGGAAGGDQPGSATSYQSSQYGGGAGGGGGGGTHGGYGADGAVRIVWPGASRQFNNSTGTNISTDI